jgi:hypothetical protein
MIVKDALFQFQWVLKATPSFATYTENYLDMQVTDPDGVVAYFEGGFVWPDQHPDISAKTFLQPTATVDGLITVDYTPAKSGVYVFIIGQGISQNFTILDTSLVLVVDQDSVFEAKVNLP